MTYIHIRSINKKVENPGTLAHKIIYIEYKTKKVEKPGTLAHI